MKSSMINFDNSATTFPKPNSVKNAVALAIAKYGGNPGRSGHRLSLETSQQIYNVRSLAAQMFGAQTENVAFTSNCTFALNMAIKGIMQYGGHIIISGYEHNSVSRPVYALSQTRGVEFSIAAILETPEKTISEFERLIKPQTKCICCTAASNVTGRIMPYKQIAELAQRKGICFILDGAQACGILDLDLSDGFNFICTAGHKALYGPTGTGLLISDGRYPLSTIIEGGTGATSSELPQTPFLPERLESGTINTVGIIGLGEGLRFVRNKTPKAIRTHEERLCKQFTDGIKNIDHLKIYDEHLDRVPIVAFNIGKENSQNITSYLSEKGFALRGGLQCSAIAHHTLGTLEQGIVRFSPSIFNNPSQVSSLVNALKHYRQN